MILLNMSSEATWRHIRLHHKVSDGFRYVITGRTGPTGKTWLCDRLCGAGYDAVEITENLYAVVDYIGTQNRYVEYPEQRLAVIVLNQHIKRKGGDTQ